MKIFEELNDVCCRLRGQIAQNVLSCRAPSNGFSKYSGQVVVGGRNRPQCASMRNEDFLRHPCLKIAGCWAEY